MKTTSGNMGMLGMLLLAMIGFPGLTPCDELPALPGAAAADQTLGASPPPPAMHRAPHLGDPGAPRLSRWSAEVLKLVQAGVDESVVVAFIRGVGTFNLAPSHIHHCRALGVSETVLSAMQARDAELAGGGPIPAVEWSGAEPQIEGPVPSGPVSPVNPAPPAGSGRVPLSGTGGQIVALAPDEQRLAYLATGDADRAFGVGERDETESRRQCASARSPDPEPATDRYPVRKPYPEPVTAPVIWISGPARPPNTVVIEWVSKP